MEKFIIGIALGIALGFSMAKYKLNLELESGVIKWTSDVEYHVEKNISKSMNKDSVDCQSSKTNQPKGLYYGSD